MYTAPHRCSHTSVTGDFTVQMIKENFVFQLPNIHSVPPTHQSVPPLFNTNSQDIFNHSQPAALQRETDNISAFQDKQVRTHLHIRTSCKAPGNPRGRRDLESEALFYLSHHKTQTLLSMAHSLAIGKVEKRNGPVVRRASARAPGELIKNDQWTRTKENGEQEAIVVPIIM